MTKSKAPALAKGLDILDLVTEHSSLSFIEIQSLTKDNPASLSRYLHTLLEKNYLHKNQNQEYELGYKLMHLSNHKSLWPKLIHSCEPFMANIHNTFGLSSLLLAYTKETYVVIEKKTAIDNLAMMEKNTVNNNHIYSIWSNLYYTCNNLSDLNQNIEKYKEYKNNLDIQDLWKQSQTQGYISLLTLPQEIFRLAFPIYSHKKVIATLGFGTFANQLSENQQKDLINSALMFTIQLSQELSAT